MIVVINGRDLHARPGDTLLDVTRRAGIPLPTLCHHEGLEEWGGCRLCLVEVGRPGGHAARVVPACLFPARDGLKADTDTARIRRLRAGVLDLLLARCPRSEKIQELALEYGVRRSTYPPRKDADNCILCHICVRACAAVGADAIGTAGRGVLGAIALPFHDDPSACVGCGACALSCPTGAIEMLDAGFTRRIWGRTFERARCASCARPTLAREHAAHLVQKTGLPPESFAVCDRCRREQSSRQFLHLARK